MSITVSGVPPYVTRTQVLHALNSLDLNPEAVMSVSFGFCGIEVEVFSDGKPDVPGYRWTHDGNNVATHRLAIPIVDKEPT